MKRNNRNIRGVKNGRNPIDKVLLRLTNIKKSGSGFTGQCPVHDDKHNSLSINESKKGDALIHCHAGCPPENIIEELGLEMSELFSDRNYFTDQDRISREQIIKTYDYYDKEGNLSFQVCRTDRKKFFQRQPDGKGGWKNGIRGIEPCLYNLGKVSEAIKNNHPVYIVEGEKDADNLVDQGFPATTSPMGAGKWKQEYSKTLQDAIVFIIPDNDEPGKKHAEAVADSLSNHAAAIHVLELPDLPHKGDVSDWIKAGGTAEAFKQLAANCPEWEPGQQLAGSKPELIKMSTVKAEQIIWLWRFYIALRKLTLLEGNPGDGKTWIALIIVAIISCGGLLPNPETGKLDLKVEPGKVIYMSAEDGAADTLKPRLDAAGANSENIFLLKGIKDEKGNYKEVTLADVSQIEAAIKQVKPVLLVIDPIQGYLGANVDMYRANETRPLLAKLSRLAEKYNCAVLCIRHLTKANSSKSIYRGMGSIDFSAAARSILLVGKDPDDPEKRAIVQIKNSLAPIASAIGFVLKEGQFFWTGKSEITTARLFKDDPDDDEKSALSDAKEFLLGALEDDKEEAAELLKEAKKQGISEKTLRRAKHALDIKAKKPKGAKNAKWTWQLPEK